jgi:hypothetical protein
VSHRIVGVVAAVLLASGVARADEVQADLGLTVIGIGYERTLAPQLTAGIAGEFMGTWFGPYFGKPWLGGLGGGVRATWYPRATAPYGLYVAPYFRLIDVSATQDGNGHSASSGSAPGFTAGIFVGESFELPAHFNLRLGVGVQYIDLAAPTSPLTELSFRSAWPALDLVVGYTFR